jgi:iron(III) transport system substrate-binding protein
MMRKCLLLLMLAAFGVTPLSRSAIGQSTDAALIAAAMKEGQVVWYTGLVVNQVVRPMADAFERKYPGISVRFSSTNSGETALRVINEKRTGRIQADVIDGTAALLPPLRAADAFDRYFPDAARDYPAEYKDTNGTWTAYTVLFMGVGYNTKQVSTADVPRTFEDLLNPKWKGKIAWTTDQTMNGAPGFIGNVLTTMGQETGMEFLRKLREQKIVNVAAAQRQVLDQVIAGEYPLALQMFNHQVALNAAQGAPIGWSAPGRAVSTAAYVGLAKGAPHANAAKLFIEFMLGDAGQNVFREANYPPASPSVSAKMPELKPDKGGFKATSFSPTDAEVNLPKWSKIYEEMFK